MRLFSLRRAIYIYISQFAFAEGLILLVFNSLIVTFSLVFCICIRYTDLICHICYCGFFTFALFVKFIVQLWSGVPGSTGVFFAIPLSMIIRHHQQFYFLAEILTSICYI